MVFFSSAWKKKRSKLTAELNRHLHTTYAHMHKVFFLSIFNAYRKSGLGLTLSNLIPCLYLILDLHTYSFLFLFIQTKDSELIVCILSHTTWIWMMYWSEQARLYCSNKHPHVHNGFNITTVYSSTLYLSNAD